MDVTRDTLTCMNVATGAAGPPEVRASVMSVSDELTSVQRCLEDLSRFVGRLEKQMGGSLEMRRVRHDADHLRESIALLRDSAQGRVAPKRPDLVTIPDEGAAREGNGRPRARAGRADGHVPETRIAALARGPFPER